MRKEPAEGVNRGGPGEWSGGLPAGFAGTHVYTCDDERPAGVDGATDLSRGAGLAPSVPSLSAALTAARASGPGTESGCGY
jgi:hypothetical protein